MDLYDDLEVPEGTQSSQYDPMKLREVNEKHEEEMALVRQGLGQCKQQNAKLLRKCTMLEKNLSCLYKTAWAHLRRKDEYIEALKHQIKAFRKLTGMVTPGVPLDANLADAIDGNPADASEEPHSKRQREEASRPAGDIQCPDQVKSPRRQSNVTSETREVTANIVAPQHTDVSTALDARRASLTAADPVRNDSLQTARQVHERVAAQRDLLHANGVRAQSAREHHRLAASMPPDTCDRDRGASKCAGQSRIQRVTSLSGPKQAHHRTSRDGNHTCTRRCRRGSVSRSPSAERCRQRALTDRPAGSAGGSKASWGGGDLRQKSVRDYRSSQWSPQHRA